MYMFSIVSLFAAFTALANAAAIPVTPTPTQAECANEQSAIAHVHDLTEQIRSKLVEMQSEGQMPDKILVVPINDAHNLAGTILAMTETGNGGAVVSISPTNVVREVRADRSGLARLFRKTAGVPGPIQTCSGEKALLAHVQDLAGQLREKLMLAQNHGGSSGLLNDVLHLVSDLRSVLLDGVVGGIAGGPLSVGGVATGVAGGVAEGAVGNVAGGVVGTGTGAASGIAGGVLGVISGSGESASFVGGCDC